MLFTSVQATAIKGGNVSELRLPLERWDPDRHAQQVTRNRQGAHVTAARRHVVIAGERWLACPFTTGDSYAVQTGRGGTVARIRATDVAHGLLGDVDAEAAKRMGFRRKGLGLVSVFQEDWAQQYGGWDPDILVWIVGIALDAERVLMMAPSHPSRPDYTTDRARALDPDAEVPPADVMAGYVKDADIRFRAERGNELARRELRSGLERIKRLARERPDAAGILARHVAAAERELSKTGAGC